MKKTFFTFVTKLIIQNNKNASDNRLQFVNVMSWLHGQSP